MTERLMTKGYTAEQARLRVVWDNPHIAGICSAMPNMTVLQANVAAALNRTQLSAGDRLRMGRYARCTAPGYCAECTHICESAIDEHIPVGDIMRHSMYLYGYGERERPLRYFDRLPERVKAALATVDCTAAERRCPQRVPIGRIRNTIHADLMVSG